MPRRPHSLRRFGSLLAALLALMLVTPFLPEGSFQLPLVNILFSVLLIASVYAVSQHPRVLVVGLLLGAPTLVLDWITNVRDPLALQVIDHAASVVFLSFVIAVLLTRILRQQDAWAYGYDLIETVVPGSFQFGEGQLPDGFSPLAQAESSRRFLYFSFVTLTTLGYGDITPVTQQARAIAISEAVAGPLFLAIFIARLVGLHMVQLQRDRD
jgi:hypothetical protein